MAVILIVEDDVFIREMAKLIIGDWGHLILSACDAPEALDHLKSSHHIDALFTDVSLKDERYGGCDVARLGVSLRPTLRVLYTTGMRDPEKIQARFAAGTHFLPKPYSEQQLGTSFRNLFVA